MCHHHLSSIIMSWFGEVMDFRLFRATMLKALVSSVLVQVPACQHMAGFAGPFTSADRVKCTALHFFWAKR